MSTNHPTRRLFRRGGVLLASVGALLLAGAGVASAHVTAHSPDQLVQGGDAEIVFRSPNEEDTASLVKLRVDFSLTSPIGDAAVKPVVGWTYQVATTTLPTPVKMANDSIKTAVKSITWTAQPGYGIKPGEFQEFDVSVEGLPTNTTTMEMPAVQTYDNGDVVNWNQPTPASGVEPDHPMPHLALAAASSSAADPAASTTPTASAGTPGMTTAASVTSSGTDGTARWLGGIGLLLAALALGFWFGTFVRARRGGPSGPGGGGGTDLDDDLDDDVDDEDEDEDEEDTAADGGVAAKGGRATQGAPA